MTDRDTHPLRLCPNERCRRVLLPADEARGRCALCGWWLQTLAPKPALEGPTGTDVRHNRLPIIAVITSEAG